MKEMDIVINIENCRENTYTGEEEFRSPPAVVDDVEKSRNVGAISPDVIKKEKRVSVSNKKSPKPPRPPRGLSLDAADQKLIKEISELLMIKRARIERIKALRKNKAAAKASSSSSSGNMIAMLFTILFCVVIVFQGCHSSGIWRRNASAIGVSTSAKADNVATEVHMLSEAGSFNLMGMVSDDAKAKGGRATY